MRRTTDPDRPAKRTRIRDSVLLALTWRQAHLRYLVGSLGEEQWERYQAAYEEQWGAPPTPGKRRDAEMDRTCRPGWQHPPHRRG